MKFEIPGPASVLIALLEISPLAIVAIDLKHRVTLWNPAAEELFGWSEGEVLGAKIPPFFRDPELGAKIEAAKSTAATGSTHVETRCAKKDGTVVDVALWYRSLFDSANKPAGHIGFVMDVTERKFLEFAMLEASEREHRRIGQDLHDHLCQQLLGAAFAAKAIGISLKREGSPAAREIDHLASLVNGSVRQVREIARGLHPVELDSGGLMSALQELARRINTTIPCRFDCEDSVLLNDAPTALHMYRIAHEAVMHLIQDRCAAHLLITLAERGREIVMNIHADGPLSPPPQDEIARKVMEYRASAMGARLIATDKGKEGLTIRCIIPLAPVVEQPSQDISNNQAVS